jgi:putative ABC transport system permease protein
LYGTITVVEDIEGASLMNFLVSEIDESVVDDLLAYSEVERVAPMIVGNTPAGGIAGFNADDMDMFDYDFKFSSGGWYEEGENEIALGAAIADLNDYAVGDVLEIRSRKYEVVGIAEEIGTADDYYIFTSVEVAQEVLGKEDKLTMAMVTSDNPDDVEVLARQIEKEIDGVRAFTEKELLRTAEELMGQINVMIYSVGGIASIIAAIVIMNVMFMSVRERTREIGALRAIGATDKQILLEISGEAVVIALIGGLIGLGLSFGSVFALNYMLGTTLARITPRLVGTVLSFAFLLGLVGGILPARRAAKLDPIVALRYE